MSRKPPLRRLPDHPLRRELAERWPDEDLLFADGLDDAIVGAAHVWAADDGGSSRRVVVLYDYERCVDALVKQGATEEEAEESLEHNTLGAYVGASTPVYAAFLHGRRPR